MSKKSKQKQRFYEELYANLNSKSRCLRCGYYRDGYCGDLDVRVDPNFPVCSEENFNS